MGWLLAWKRAAGPGFVRAQVPEDAALVIKALADGTKGTVERAR